MSYFGKDGASSGSRFAVFANASNYYFAFAFVCIEKRTGRKINGKKLAKKQFWRKRIYYGLSGIRVKVKVKIELRFCTLFRKRMFLLNL